MPADLLELPDASPAAHPRAICAHVKCDGKLEAISGCVTERSEIMAKGRDKRKESKGKKKAPKKP